MPSGLKRYQQTRQLHFVTFTCYHRKSLLADPRARDLFVQTLKTVRRWYSFWLIGYVVMPEHVHLLLSEPERKSLSLVLQMLKQMVSRKLGTSQHLFWQARYYDFNCGASESASRSCATFTEIRCREAWWRVRRTGCGAVSATI